MWRLLLVVLAAVVLSHCDGEDVRASRDWRNEGTEVDKPQMYNFHVESVVRFRFAHTVVSSRIANPANISQEVSFSAVLPRTAFISGFRMVVDDQVYSAYVQTKAAAKEEYSEAVRQGRTAAHVSLSPRDSNRITVSVNVEPRQKVTFNLTYEELLVRKLGAYEHVINLDPGQIVPDLSVEVRIEESANVTTLSVPALKVSNEINTDPAAGAHNPLVTVERPTPESAVVRFAPTPEQQRELARDGIRGQLVVKYDVERTQHPGQVVVSDGYFVHFFAPVDLPPLPKHVIFVLDVSGSMSGRKLRQLKEAMATILDDLNRGDLFSIVVFSEKVEVWDPALGEAEMQDNLGRLRDWTESTTDAERSGTPPPSVITAVTLENTNKAKRFVQNLTTYSATNIHGALMKALQILEVGRSASPEQTNHAEERPEPMIIFLTDGQANVGVSDTFSIVSSVTAANAGNSSIFSLALGNGADFPFLKKLSLRNSGFARKIYEASDTALQLTDFYRQVASPLLANVTFSYQPDQVEPQSVTRLAFRRFFSGSELVVAGRLHGNNVTGEVQAHSSSGSARYPFDPVILPTTPTANTMERLWAYLTIQQLLEDDDASTSPGKQRALELALTYSFVTPLTSLVVVRPDNETRPVEPEEASFAAADRSRAPSHVSPVSLSSFPVQGAAKTSHNAYSRILPGASQDMRPISSSGAYYADLILPAYPVSTSASLDDILWLSPNDTTVSLPTGVNGTSEVLNLATADETNAAYAACVTPGGQPGHCRHLKYCVLLTFLNNQTEFLPFFCRIDSFVGVCCQDDS